MPTPSVSEWKPFKVFTFDSTQEFTAMAGGFLNPPVPGGSIEIGKIAKGTGEYTDGQGAILTLAPGQVELLMFPSLEVGDSLALIRVSVQATGPGAAIALALLDGSFDGSIATNIPADSAIYQEGWQRMTLIYDPPGTTLVPVFQVANLPGKQTIQVYLDNLEVYLLPIEGNVPARLLYGR